MQANAQHKDLAESTCARGIAIYVSASVELHGQNGYMGLFTFTDMRTCGHLMSMTDDPVIFKDTHTHIDTALATIPPSDPSHAIYAQ